MTLSGDMGTRWAKKKFQGAPRFGSGLATHALTPEIGVTKRILACPGGIWASNPAANTPRDG